MPGTLNPSSTPVPLWGQITQRLSIVCLQTGTTTTAIRKAKYLIDGK